MQFYTAGKIWHADKFRFLRDTVGMLVQARWIDINTDQAAEMNKTGALWQQCYEDVRDSDFVLVYCEDFTEEQRGALVEIGMAYGMGKPVYCVGVCQSFKANAISDVAFTHFPLWTWLNESNLTKGAYYATAMEIDKQMRDKKRA